MKIKQAIEHFVKRSLPAIFSKAIGVFRSHPEYSNELMYYLRLLSSHSDLFKEAIKRTEKETGLKFGEYPPDIKIGIDALEKELLKGLMEEFFIDDTPNNRDYFYGFYYGHRHNKKSRVFDMTDVSADNPDSVTLAMPGVMIVLDEYVNQSEWSSLYKEYSKEIEKLKKIKKVTSHSNVNIDEKLLVYRWKKQRLSNQLIASKLRERRKLKSEDDGVFITAEYVGVMFKEIKDLIEKL